MTIQLGDTAPDFTAETTEGTVTLHSYLGEGWGVLFSHPADFTPVCTTELGEFARRRDEFARAQHEAHRRERRLGRLPSEVVRGHCRDSGAGPQLSPRRR